MTNQIVITEKTSQAKDVRAGGWLSLRRHPSGRGPSVRPARAGRCCAGMEALVADPSAARRSLRHSPGGGRQQSRQAQSHSRGTAHAKRVWLATDCDREGQLIGQEILEHYEYRGQVMRVMFTAQDPQTIRDAFGRAKPNAEYARLYAAAVARRQADQIYNLSLTRTATVILGRGARRVIGVGRVKTPTLAIVCKRELEIRNFVPQAYFEVVATAQAAGGKFQMRHAPQERIVKRADAEGSPPSPRVSRVRLLCASRISGKGHPGCMICRRCRNSAARASAGRPADARGGAGALRRPGQEDHHLSSRRGALSAAELDLGRAADHCRTAGGPLVQRDPRARAAGHPQGCKRHLLRQGAGGREPSCRHPQRQHGRQIAGGLASPVADEKKLFDVIARAYLAALMPDFRYRQTTATLDVRGFVFRAPAGSPSISAGAQHSRTGNPPTKRATRRNCCRR